mmetsp:Transcript_2305/g.5484  ORF Transcript_2305/g.5484 Transcript_2305/m.5484 type:complete len:228 (+) Transcript_2305:2383-3066(+)
MSCGAAGLPARWPSDTHAMPRMRSMAFARPMMPCLRACGGTRTPVEVVSWGRGGHQGLPCPARSPRRPRAPALRASQTTAVETTTTIIIIHFGKPGVLCRITLGDDKNFLARDHASSKWNLQSHASQLREWISFAEISRGVSERQKKPLMRTRFSREKLLFAKTISYSFVRLRGGHSSPMLKRKTLSCFQFRIRKYFPKGLPLAEPGGSSPTSFSTLLGSESARVMS